MAMVTGTADFQAGNNNKLQEVVQISGINYMVDVIKLTNDSLISVQSMGTMDVKENIDSNLVSCTSFTNTVLATLIASMNTHLSNSSKKLIGIQFFTHSLVTVLYGGVIFERN